MSTQFDSVSVVIPAFNRADSLPRAIGSALNQTCVPAEIIVVDDASTDLTPALMLEQTHPRVRYVRLRQNGGAPRARNTGTRLARGRWIAFLDADDEWLPHKLERQLDAMTSAGDPGFCVSNLLARNDAGEEHTWNTHEPPHAAENLSHFLMVEGGALQTSTLLVRRDLALAHPFAEDLQKHQDWDLMLRLAASGQPWVYVADPLSVYVMDNNPQRISRSRPNVNITLDWLRASPHVSQEAAAYFFARHCFGRALRQLGTRCTRVLFELGMRSPAAARGLTRGLRDLAMSRARLMVGRPA
ncbi:MAG: glycosyltransferase [Candidatus Dactylopiibacterium sp.]|nr:glycosyltransferase [Candidatus Dactylopiibacterium sp.]